MIVETIQNAIDAIRQQSELIDRYVYSEDAESADSAQRKAHKALAELTALKAQVEAGAQIQAARAA